MVIYVIGFLGADRIGAATKKSEELGLPLYDLNKEIEKRDGRSVRRMVIMMGEHELRNKEYDTLVAILGELGETALPDTVDPDMPPVCSRCAATEAEAELAAAIDPEAAFAEGTLGQLFRGKDEYTAVICCNDDVVLDPQSAEIIRAGEVIVVEEDPEVMFQRASEDTETHYAFLMDGNEDRRRAKFMELYERRKGVYDSFRK